MYSQIQLSSPTNFLGLPDAKSPASTHHIRAGEYAQYVKRYAHENGIKPICREVQRVERDGLNFRVTYLPDTGSNCYAFIVVCTGSFDHPNVPIIPGLNETHNNGEITFSHARHWKGPTQYKSSGRLLIIGGGMSAIEIAEECVRTGLKPVISFREGRGKTFPPQVFGFDPRRIVYPFMRRLPLAFFRRSCMKGWKYRGVDRGFTDYCKMRLIDVRPGVRVVQGRRITFTDGSTADIDNVILATGYRWDMTFLPDSVPKRLQGNPVLRRGESIAWPGLFCVGISCAFSPSSHFIHGISVDARKVAETISRRIDNRKNQRKTP
jgi:hypothetical protein